MAHPVDVHVGKRIRQRRWLTGMTQQQWLRRSELNSNKFKNMKPVPTASAPPAFGILPMHLTSR